MRRAQALLLAAILFAGLVGTTAWYKENGLADIFELNDAIEGLDAKIASVEQENRELRVERVALVKSDAHIGGIAREDLGLVKPDEVVYKFVEMEDLASPKSPEAYMTEQQKNGSTKDGGRAK